MVKFNPPSSFSFDKPAECQDWKQRLEHYRIATKLDKDDGPVQVFSLLIVAIGVYAKVQKATDTVRDTFLIDPAVILIVFSFSLTLVFLTQLAIAILGFFYSDQTRDALGKFVKNAIVHYRDDLDLQNLMDYIQKEFKCCGWNNYTDWSWNLYFNCTDENPSSERCAVPYSCCTPVPGEAVINTMCGFGVQTQTYLDANKSIYPVGCADRAVMWIESHLLLVGALTLGLALPQIAGIVLSQILISQIQDEITSAF
ncbi:tetraspanin-33b isoform X3 [Cololabis saira]|uniref:tetraspanin-33b isoform X3 n=1 Tax=Cololabis saira TaxID=129043 RepID=UPI002AD3C802|nr:tetraspanin-33b isoform X3 [Cololabis saira]